MTETHDLYNQAQALLARYKRVEDFPTIFYLLLRDKVPYPPTFKLLARILVSYETIYQQTVRTIPDIPPNLSGIHGARYRDQLRSLMNELAGNRDIAAVSALLESAAALINALPPIARSTWELIDKLDAGLLPHPSSLTVPVQGLIKDIPRIVENMLTPLYDDEVVKLKLLPELHDTINHNVRTLDHKNKDAFRPTLYQGDPAHTPHAYLKDTLLYPIFTTRIPVEVPERLRFEHMWIVAGTGFGKTQTLQYFINQDLDAVARGQRSVIVIDSQEQMIPAIAQLRDFYDGPLQDRLCLIDPTDLEYPLALNLLDIGQARLTGYSRYERERLTEGVIELYNFVIASILGGDFTTKQATLFQFVTRLLLTIPDATLHTFRQLMEPNAAEAFAPYIGAMSQTAQAFFAEFYDQKSKQYSDTRSEVQRRLYSILENPTFDRMFSHPHNKLDMYQEMNAGKVILINTSRSLLKQHGLKLFGRFFIALISQAIDERAATRDQLPCHIYIDEAAEYFDQTITHILEQARKYNIGLTVAHQHLNQLPQNVHASLAANTSIKMAGGISPNDLTAFGSMLRADKTMLQNLPVGHFATTVRGLIPEGVSLRIPFGVIENQPQTTPTQFEEIRDLMRERYAAEPAAPSKSGIFPRSSPIEVLPILSDNKAKPTPPSLDGEIIPDRDY
jgi:hypothetical protein